MLSLYVVQLCFAHLHKQTGTDLQIAFLENKKFALKLLSDEVVALQQQEYHIWMPAWTLTGNSSVVYPASWAMTITDRPHL